MYSGCTHFSYANIFPPVYIFQLHLSWGGKTRHIHIWSHIITMITSLILLSWHLFVLLISISWTLYHSTYHFSYLLFNISFCSLKSDIPILFANIICRSDKDAIQNQTDILNLKFFSVPYILQFPPFIYIYIMVFKYLNLKSSLKIQIFSHHLTIPILELLSCRKHFYIPSFNLLFTFYYLSRPPLSSTNLVMCNIQLLFKFLLLFILVQFSNFLNSVAFNPKLPLYQKSSISFFPSFYDLEALIATNTELPHFQLNFNYINVDDYLLTSITPTSSSSLRNIVYLLLPLLLWALSTRLIS